VSSLLLGNRGFSGCLVGFLEALAALLGAPHKVGTGPRERLRERFPLKGVIEEHGRLGSVPQGLSSPRGLPLLAGIRLGGQRGVVEQLVHLERALVLPLVGIQLAVGVVLRLEQETVVIRAIQMASINEGRPIVRGRFQVPLPRVRLLALPRPTLSSLAGRPPVARALAS